MKRVGKCFLFGLILGIVLLIIKIKFGIEDAVIYRILIYVGIAIIGVALIFNFIYNLHYNIKINKLIVLLDKGQNDEYINGIEQLLTKAKGKYLPVILKIDLCAGYIEAKRFDEALPILEELMTHKLKPEQALLCHRVNLCLCYFQTNQIDKAISLYDENKPLFRKYKDTMNHGGHIAILHILKLVANGENEKALAGIEKAKGKWSNARIQKALDEIKDTL